MSQEKGKDDDNDQDSEGGDIDIPDGEEKESKVLPNLFAVSTIFLIMYMKNYGTASIMEKAILIDQKGVM